MKESKTCPKCQGSSIFTDAGMSKRGERCYLPVSSWSKLFLDVYVCADCGFVEEYLSDSELTDLKSMSKLRENWKKHG